VRFDPCIECLYEAGMSSTTSTACGPHHGAIITTPRLLLRTLREADISELHQRIFGVRDVMRRVFAGAAMTAAESKAFIRDNFSSTVAATSLGVLVDRASGDVLGFAGLLPSTALAADDPEIGFVLARHAWGHGFATEIGRAQLAHGFAQLGRPRLLALVAEANAASIRTVQKLGMSYHSTVEPVGRSPRRVYCLAAEDWRRSGAE